MDSKKFEDLMAGFAEAAQKDFAEIRASQKETALQMKETDRKLKELGEETDRRLKELGEETDRQMKETALQMKETDRKLDRLGEQIGGINDNIGFHAEQYFQNILAEKLTFGGQKYDRMLSNVECTDKNNVPQIEFDIMLVNGKSVAIIETKSRIHPNFAKELVEKRLPKFKEFLPEFSKYKIYLGIAGFSFSKKVLSEAEKYGIGIIRQVGNSIEIKADKLTAY